MLDARGLVAAVAANVRALRAAAGLTLPALAERTGLGRSTLAQLESGRANPSIETLWAIARALDVPFGRLIEPAAPAVRLLRAGEGVRIGAASSPVLARLLVASPRRGSFELYVLEAEPGATRHAEPHGPGLVEHLLVMEGRLRAGPEDAAAELASGDVLSFPGDVPHLYEALAPGTRAALVMDYP